MRKIKEKKSLEDEDMVESCRIRTDLALEKAERFTEENVEIRGVEVHENYNEEKDIRTTVVKIRTENGAKAMGRPQGNYITIEAPNLSLPDEDYHREVSEEIASHLRQLINLEKEKSILVVGLGNQSITADSLGPDVVDNLHMTRHIIREYGLKSMGEEKMHRISGIVPGVMAQTGMETSEIIQGVVSETKPDVVVAIDALAARSTRRLNRTIQITDTGINPGSGVGNHRVGLTEDNLQVKVIGIGVPTVVDAATIVYDSMAHLLEALEEAEQKEFLEEMISPNLHSMFVTPKDVDETVKYLSFTISEGLNMAFAQV
jgi:spore protease